MIEALLASVIAVLNCLAEIGIEKASDRFPDRQSLIFAMRWNAFRFFALMIMVGSVILWTPIRPVIFIIAFAIAYSLTILFKLIRYGIT